MISFIRGLFNPRLKIINDLKGRGVAVSVKGVNKTFHLKEVYSTVNSDIMLARYKTLNSQRLNRVDALEFKDEAIGEYQVKLSDAKESMERIAAKMQLPEHEDELLKLQTEFAIYQAEVSVCAKTINALIQCDPEIKKIDEELELLQTDPEFYEPIIRYVYEIEEEDIQALRDSESSNIVIMLGFFLLTTIEYGKRLSKITH